VDSSGSHPVYEVGALEVHMRPACPPLVYGCKFLNFSISGSEMDLAARRAIREIEGENGKDLTDYTCHAMARYKDMEERVRKRLKLTTLKYQWLEDLVDAISLPKDKICPRTRSAPIVGTERGEKNQEAKEGYAQARWNRCLQCRRRCVVLSNIMHRSVGSNG
jgi:glutamine phosphoribosylpyrophosphate amidotransferase